MSTPAYREAKNRLSDMDWNTSVQNLMNWSDKGAMQLNKLIPALKKIALQDGANSLPFYMYLDNELMDIEHLCCLAHARQSSSMPSTREARRQESSLSR